MHPFDGDGMAGKPSDRSKTSKLPIESHPAEEVYPIMLKNMGMSENVGYIPNEIAI